MTSPDRRLGVIPTPAATGMLFGDAGATVATSRHASLWLDDGSGGSPRPTVSLWQLNLQSLRADRWFQIAFRRDAVVWAAVSGSP